MFEVCCRLCLDQVPLGRVQSLYDKHQDYTIRDKITELFQISFTATEKLSTVCNDCLGKIDTVNKIRAFFLESNERFRRVVLGCEDKQERKEPKQDEEKDSLVAKSVVETDDGDPDEVKLEPSDSAAKINTNTEFEPIPSENEEEEEHLVMVEEIAEEEHLGEDSPNVSVSIYDESDRADSEQKPDADEEEDFQLQEMELDEPEETVEVLSEVCSSEQEEEKCSSNEVVVLDEAIKRTVSIGAPGDEEFSVVMIEYQCNVCNEVFEDRVSLVRHTNGTHIHEYPKNCRHCLSVFKTDEELKEHECVEKPRLFKCFKCNRSFQTVKELQVHTKISHRAYEVQIAKPQPPARRSKPLNQCDHCPKTFTNNRKLVQHVQDVHPEVKTILTCVRCEQQFVNAPSLQAHMEAHEKNYECRFCGKVCPTSVSLAGHENTHTKDQPFQCSECGRNFAQYTSMRRHMKIHYNEKKYSCDLCSMLFRQRSVMLTHRRIHTGEKPFECGVCKKSFRDHSTLAKHRRIHEKGGVAR